MYIFFHQERVYRPTESSQMGVIDPHSRIMVLHLCAGLLKICIKTYMYMHVYIVTNVVHVHVLLHVHVHVIFVLYINFCTSPGSATGSEV